MFHSTIAVVMPPKKKKKTVTTSLDAPSTSTAEIAELKASNMDLVKRVETLTELVSASLQKKDESQDIVNGVKEVHKDKTRITRSSTQDKDKSIDDDESKDTEEQEQEGQVVKPNQVLEPGKHSNNVAGPSKEDLKLDEDVISAALQKTFGTVDTNKGECLSSFLVAGFTLDTKIKNKIWAGQYVELGSLIPRNEYASTVHMAYAPASISQVSLTPTRAKQPNNFAEWLSWFSIYASVYCEQHPAQAPQLFTYISRIQNLSFRRPISYVWRAYDECFRRVKAFSPGLPWHIIQDQILRDAEDLAAAAARNQSFRRAANNNNNNNQSGTNARHEGQRGDKSAVCFDYNDINKPCKRPVCKFPHKCSKCHNNHPAYQCKRDGKGTNGSGSQTKPTNKQ